MARAEDVLAAAGTGDPDAVRVVRDAGEAVGAGVGFLVNVLDPEAVVVGGGLGLAGGLYWDAFIDSVRRHVWAEATREPADPPGRAGGRRRAARRGRPRPGPSRVPDDQ